MKCIHKVKDRSGVKALDLTMLIHVHMLIYMYI